MDISDLDTFVDAYTEAALWATTDGDEPLDDNYDAGDLDGSALRSIRADCEDFVTANLTDLAGIAAEQAGHDFLLTRDHHGAGFWARGLGDIGDRLTVSAHVYGDSGLYVGDDDVIYVAGAEQS